MKKLLLLALVALGVYMAATESGNRTFTRIWASVAGKPALDLDFMALSPQIDENQLAQRFTSLKLKCHAEQSNLGDRVCTSEIRAVNDVPAQYAAFFFKDSRLSNVKLALSGRDHPRLTEKLKAQYGAWQTVGSRNDIHGNPIVGWHLDSGILAISETVPENAESTVLWISNQALLSR